MNPSITRMNNHDLALLGWYEAKTEKAIVVNYQSADGSICYRYKGSRRNWLTTPKSFHSRFKNYNDQTSPPLPPIE